MRTDSIVADLEFAVAVAGAEPITVGAHLTYEAHDPFAVCVSFEAGPAERIEWTFARELLDVGLSRPIGDGDVKVWPYASRVCLALRSPAGRAVLETTRGAIADFVARTLRVVPAGREAEFMNLDRELDALLS